MTLVVLSLHLQQYHKDTLSNQPFDTYKECVDHYMDYISRINKV